MPQIAEPFPAVIRVAGMTRIAPTLTLLAVAALGAGMFVANAVNDPTSAAPSAPAQVALAAPGPVQISLADIPVVGAPAEKPAGAAGGRSEISLAEVPVAGASGTGASGTGTSGAAAAVPAAGGTGRVEVSLADIPVVTPVGGGAPANAGDSAATAGAPSAFAGRTDNDRFSVAVAVQGDRATAYVCRAKSIEAWLSGSVTGDTLSLKTTSGRTTLTGTVRESSVTGTVTIDGAETTYTAAATDVATAAANGRPDVGRVVQRLGGTG